jgi:hypothetical protein
MGPQPLFCAPPRPKAAARAPILPARPPAPAQHCCRPPGRLADAAQVVRRRAGVAAEQRAAQAAQRAVLVVAVLARLHLHRAGGWSAGWSVPGHPTAPVEGVGGGRLRPCPARRAAPAASPGQPGVADPRARGGCKPRPCVSTQQARRRRAPAARRRRLPRRAAPCCASQRRRQHRPCLRRGGRGGGRGGGISLSAGECQPRASPKEGPCHQRGGAARQPGGQAGRRAGGQAGRRAGRRAGGQAGRRAGRRAGGQAGRRAGGRAGRQAGRQAGGQEGRARHGAGSACGRPPAWKSPLASRRSTSVRACAVSSRWQHRRARMAALAAGPRV